MVVKEDIHKMSFCRYRMTVEACRLAEIAKAWQV